MGAREIDRGRTAGLARLFHVPQISLVVTDQMLLSGGNFLTLLMLGRWLAPGAFGSFALGFSVLLLAKNFHLALVTTPLMAIGGGMGPVRLQQYRSTLMRMHLLFTVATVVVLIAGGLALGALRAEGTTVSMLPALVAAVAAFLWQEFARRSLLTAQRRGAALLNDAVRYGIQVPALLFCHMTGRLSVVSALYVVALGCAAGGLLGLWQDPPTARVKRSRRRAWYRETLAFGKWLAGHYAGVWVVERWYLVGVAALLSTVEVGVIAACFALVGVSNVFYLSLENYATPVLAKLVKADGLDGFRALFLRLVGLGGLVFGVGCLAVALCGEPLLTALFGLKYTGYGWFLAFVAAQAFVGFFARIAAIGLKILRRSREVFWAYIGAAAVTVATSVPLITSFGLSGAAWGLIATQLALAVPLSYWLFGSAPRPAASLTRCAPGA